MPTLEDLADRVERLLLRYDETKRTNVLLEQQLHTVVAERDNLRARLAAARSRIDDLIDQLPPDALASAAPDAATESSARPAGGKGGTLAPSNESGT